MNALFLTVSLLLLLNCGQDTKSPAGPVQPEGPATDSARIAVFADTSLETAVREALQKPAGPLTQEDLLSLTRLVARGRGIVSLTGIDSLKNLQVLDLADNQIQDISPLAALTQLTYLDLEDNQVSDLSPLAGLAQLELLVLSGNRISEVSVLLGLVRLRSLELGRNPLGQVALGQQVPALEARGVQVVVDQAAVVEPPPASPVVFADHALEMAVRRALKKIDPSIPLSREELLAITSLSARGWPVAGGPSKIADLGGIEQLANLVSLDLEGNQISDLSPLASLTRLAVLCLNYNQIADLAPLASLQSLVRLEAHVNQVRDLSPLRQLPQLLNLKMFNNQISDLSPLESLTQLEGLALGNAPNPNPAWGNNQISDISPLASLVHLKLLDLPNNQVQDIAVLMHLPELVRVDLTGNPLSEEARSVHIPALRYSGEVIVIF